MEFLAGVCQKDISGVSRSLKECEAMGDALGLDEFGIAMSGSRVSDNSQGV